MFLLAFVGIGMPCSTAVLIALHFDSPKTSDASREGESEPLRTKEDEPLRVVVGSIPCPMSEERRRKPNEEHNLKVYTTRQPTSECRWRKPNKEENLRMHTRRQSQHQQHARTNSEVELQGSSINTNIFQWWWKLTHMRVNHVLLMIH
jgi:hypothetical protein